MFTKVLVIVAVVAYAGAIEYAHDAHHHAYSSVSHHAAPLAHYAHAAPVAHYAHAAPVAHYAHAAPVAHYAAPIAKAVHHEVYPDAHPEYAFNYGVHDAHTGDNKNQHEERNGDAVHGEYQIVQPDGVTRTVHYSADDHNGFNAHVEYSGHAAKAVVAAPIAAHAAPAYYHH